MSIGNHLAGIAVALCAVVVSCSSCNTATRVTGTPDGGATMHRAGTTDGRTTEPDGGNASRADGAVSVTADSSAPGSAAAWPTDPPPAEPAAPLHTDDCDFGARTGDFVILAKDDIVSLAVNEKYVYLGTSSQTGCPLKFCTSDHRLKRLPRCGGAVEEIADTTDSIVLGGAGVAYWSEGNDLMRYTEAESSIEVIDREATCLEHIVANATGMYAYSRCRMAFVSAKTTDDVLKTGPAYAPSPSALAATAARVYFSDATGVQWWSPDTGARGRAATAGAGARALTVSPSGIFTMATPGAQLAAAFSVSRIGADGSVTPLSDHAILPPFALDNASVYWPDRGGVQVATGSDAAQVALERTVSPVSAYGGRLFWSEGGSSQSGATGYLLTGKPAKAPVGASPASREPAWEKRYSGTQDALVASVALDAAGNAFVLGSARAGTTDLGGGPIVIAHDDTPLFAKIDPSGNHLWSFAIPEGGTSRNPTCLGVNASGASIVTFDDAVDLSNPKIRAFTASGDALWSYAGPSYRIFRACAVTAAGHVWVTDDVDPLSPNHDAGPALHLLHLDATGAQRQDLTLGTLDQDETFIAHQLVVSSSQDAFALTGALTGSTDLGDGVRDAQGASSVLVTKLNADGTLAWSRLLRGAETSQVGFDGSGHVVVAGRTSTFVDFGSGPQWVRRPLEKFAYVATFDANGALILSKIYDAGVAAFAVASDGTFVLGGYGRAYFPDAKRGVSFPGPHGSWFARFAADGTLASAFGNAAMEYGLALAMSDMRLVVASGSATPDMLDFRWDIGAYTLP
jgi:predicted secreted protein